VQAQRMLGAECLAQELAVCRISPACSALASPRSQLVADSDSEP